jgi:hypothetical protein
MLSAIRSTIAAILLAIPCIVICMLAAGILVRFNISPLAIPTILLGLIILIATRDQLFIYQFIRRTSAAVTMVFTFILMSPLAWTADQNLQRTVTADRIVAMYQTKPDEAKHTLAGADDNLLQEIKERDEPLFVIESDRRLKVEQERYATLRDVEEKQRIAARNRKPTNFETLVDMIDYFTGPIPK